MTSPLVAGVCPCANPSGGNDFCDEHAGAVAFKVPVAPSGEVLPAVWWHWAHRYPCPHGDGWILTPASGGDGATPWACPHRRHDDQLPGEHGLPEAAAV
jgi:hypothetical protein